MEKHPDVSACLLHGKGAPRSGARCAARAPAAMVRRRREGGAGVRQQRNREVEATAMAQLGQSRPWRGGGMRAREAEAIARPWGSLAPARPWDLVERMQDASVVRGDASLPRLSEAT